MSTSCQLQACAGCRIGPRGLRRIKGWIQALYTLLEIWREAGERVVRGDVHWIALWENEMAERPLTSFHYLWFPDEFRFYIRYEIATPGEDPSVSKSRSLVCRSKGRPDFAVGIPAGWTDEDVMAALAAGHAFAIPSVEQGKWSLYPPIEYFALVCGCSHLLSPLEMLQQWNTKTLSQESVA